MFIFSHLHYSSPVGLHFKTLATCYNTHMIDLTIQQSWLKSSDTSLEEFKSTLADTLNNLWTDRHVEGRWEITKVSESETAHLVYDEQPVAGLRIEHAALRLYTAPEVPRHDDLLYAIRLAAYRLGLYVYDNQHGRARLASDPDLVLNHTFFERDEAFQHFFEHSDYIPRYAIERYERRDNQILGSIHAPFFAEHKQSGEIHILNNAMVEYLVQKENQTTNREFAYKVADSLHDFASKYDLSLVPMSFYANYGKSVKILNDTYFDVDHITRKVFIDPYVWDFDTPHESRYYQNTKNGMHLMDKVRKGETLDSALRRVLREELQAADDYVGARVWGIDFDRDREGALTPRLKINVFVHGLAKRQASKDHDWVSIK